MHNNMYYSDTESHSFTFTPCLSFWTKRKNKWPSLCSKNLVKMYKAILEFRVFILKSTLKYTFWSNALYTFLCECLLILFPCISETIYAGFMHKPHLTPLFGISIQGHFWKNIFFSTSTLNNTLVKIRCFFNFVSGFRLMLILMTTSHGS